MSGRVTRRRFVRDALAAGALAGALASRRGSAADSHAGGRRVGAMKLGLVTYQMGEKLALEELITLCERTGFEGMELRTTHAHGVEPSLDAAQRQAVRDRVAQSPVVICCLGTTCEFDSPDAAVVQQHVQEARRFADLARDVGAQAIKVRPNNLHEDQGIPVEQTLKQIGAALTEVGGYAEERGIEVWVEIHGRGTAHVPHCRTIMDACGHPNVGLTWNCNAQDIVEGSIRENWLLVRDWIRCLHIHDLYDRSYPWKELFALCHETGFDGWANQEMGGSSDAERVLHYYRALFDAMVEEARRG